MMDVNDPQGAYSTIFRIYTEIIHKIVSFIFLVGVNDDEDYELKLSAEFAKLRHFIFEKYVRNRKNSCIYGCKKRL